MDSQASSAVRLLRQHCNGARHLELWQATWIDGDGSVQVRGGKAPG